MSVQVHPTKAGYYYVVTRPNGSKGKKKYLPVKGYEQAAALDRELKARKGAPVVEATHPRLKDVYEEYLAWVKANKSSKTHQVYTYNLEGRIIPHFGAYRVEELTVPLFDAFQKSLEGKRKAIILYLNTLTAMVDWMVERNYAPVGGIGFNVKLPRYHAPKPVIPSMPDIQQVIDYVGDPAKKALLVTMLWTGLRWNETRLLRWEDVYVSRGFIRVRESDQEEEVHIAVYPEMMPWYKANKKPHGWVFLNPRTQEPWTSFKTLFKEANRRLKLETSISHHDFRRRFAQNVYEASGYDITVAQLALRHKDVKTTQRYLGVSEQRRAEVMGRLISHVSNLRKPVKPQGKPKKPKG